MDAVVLAGGTIPEREAEFRAQTGVDCKSLIPLAGRIMVGHVVTALRAASRIDRVAVVGPACLGDHADCADADLVLPEGSGRSENLFGAMDALGTSDILMVTSDIPLATGAMYDDVLEHLDSEAELGYAFIRHDTVLPRFADRPLPPPEPDGTQMPNWVTVQLRDGRFTGTPCMMLRGRGRAAFEPFIKSIFDNREMRHVIATLRPVLGLSLLLRLGLAAKLPACGRLISIAEVERRIGRGLGIVARGYCSPHAELAFDVDHLTDVPFAARILQERAR